MDDNRPLHEQAYEDYKNGLKQKEIADKYGVTISAVKSWKSRHWSMEKLQPKGKKVATKSEKGCNQKSEKVATKNKKVSVPKKKPGGQLGNKNAEGAGAPQGNKNRLVHGIYSMFPLGSLSPEDEDYLLNGEIDPDKKLEIEIRALDLRMRELLAIRDRELKQALRRNGMSVKGMVKKLPQDGEGATGGTMDLVSVNDILLKLEAELTRLQKEKIKALSFKMRNKNEATRLTISTSKLDIEQKKFFIDAEERQGKGDVELPSLADSIKSAWESRENKP